MHYVIIPTYQERDNIQPTVTAVLGVSPEVRVVVVDDDSTDGTKERLNALQDFFGERLKVIHRPAPRSFAGSYIDGFTHALSQSDCESVLECDADGSHPTYAIPFLLERLREVDVVIGSRYVAGGNIDGFSKNRLWLSSAANLYLRFTTGLRIADITAGFVGYRSDFLRRLPYQSIDSNGYAFQIEMKWLSAQEKARFLEYPITFIDRSKGQSKMSFHTMVEALFIGFRYFFRPKP